MPPSYEIHLGWIDQQLPRMVALLESWSAINTGSHHISGLAAQAAAINVALTPLGQVENIPLPPQAAISDTGNPVALPLGSALALRSPHRPGPRVLLGIHYDTVFQCDHPFQNPTREGDTRLRGPGVCDAKGGLVVLLFALLALERSPFAAHLNWELLLNPDEEIGSPGSAPLWQAAAKRNDLALLFEPALPDGGLVSARKGSGNFTWIVHGKAAHAGRAAHDGRNAIHALSQLIARLPALPQEIPGIVVNTGFIHGGGPVNIVPDRALCRFNIRVENAAQQLAVEARLAELTAPASLPEGIRLEALGNFHAPPKPLTPAIQRLLQHLADTAALQGVSLAWHATGGASDGNRLAAAGLPVVDSLGVRGGNIHTDQEFVLLESLAERARLAACFLMRLAAGEIPPHEISRQSPLQPVTPSAEVTS